MAATGEKMRLFHSAASPYVRKVLVCAREKGVVDRVELLSSAAGPVKRDQSIVVHNPTGKVPTALVDGDVPLFDSRVICAYVDAMADEPQLIPREPSERFAVLTLEALADAILDAALLCRYETALRPKALQWDDWYEGQMAKIDSGLDDLATRWQPQLDGRVTVGSIAVACALGYLGFRFADKDWQSGHPALAGWYESFCQRPSMQATAPE